MHFPLFSNSQWPLSSLSLIFYSSEKTLSTKVFVGQLTEDIYPDELRQLFCKFGRVVECDVVKDYGFVVSIISVFSTVL